MNDPFHHIMTFNLPNPRQHAHTFHLQRLLNASSTFTPSQRSAFLKNHIQLGEIAEMAVRGKSTRIPNVPAVFVERAFRERLQAIVNKIEKEPLGLDDLDENNHHYCDTTRKEETGINVNHELSSSDTMYQKIFDQFIEMESEVE
jgi:hypothetical protein